MYFHETQRLTVGLHLRGKFGTHAWLGSEAVRTMAGAADVLWNPPLERARLMPITVGSHPALQRYLVNPMSGIMPMSKVPPSILFLRFGRPGTVTLPIRPSDELFIN